MIEVTQTRTLAGYKRLRNTPNGNPRYTVSFTDGAAANIAHDSQVVHFVNNPGLRPGDTVTVTFDGAGDITHMKPTTES